AHDEPQRNFGFAEVGGGAVGQLVQGEPGVLVQQDAGGGCSPGGRSRCAGRCRRPRYPKPNGARKFTVKDGKQVPVPPHLEWRIAKGATWSIFTRVAIGVVDQAGERPD
ncbi:MAG: hypothetical protein M3127_02465, partial [Actinomycetota bacterium]|nr:hypothetical protein [Actinomycetota bacterium]